MPLTVYLHGQMYRNIGYMDSTNPIYSTMIIDKHQDLMSSGKAPGKILLSSVSF